MRGSIDPPAERCSTDGSKREMATTVLLEPPRRGEVQVRVAAAGVCHSDVHLADGLLGEGRWPRVLGHERAGVVAAIGEDVTEVAPGDHVAILLRALLWRLPDVPRRASHPVRDGGGPRCRRDADGRHLTLTCARRNRAPTRLDGGLLCRVCGRAGGGRGALAPRRSRCGRRRWNGCAGVRGHTR